MPGPIHGNGHWKTVGWDTKTARESRHWTRRGRSGHAYKQGRRKTEAAVICTLASPWAAGPIVRIMENAGDGCRDLRSMSELESLDLLATIILSYSTRSINNHVGEQQQRYTIMPPPRGVQTRFIVRKSCELIGEGGVSH